jgi:CRISPR-associated endonuclease/helicase Cas3
VSSRVSETRLPLVDHRSAHTPLYPHQVAIWEGWEKHPTMLLAAKTGTGKTRSAMLPVVNRREWAVAVYPTNELVRDQVRAVAKFMRDEGSTPLVLTPEVWAEVGKAESYTRAGHVLVPVDGSLLNQWQEAMHCRSRGETLRRILDPDKPKIVFTNPDILFLILGLRYHAEPFEALRRYETLIMDEFHLYQGVELAHALFMIALARGFGMFQRLILLSATPHPEVRSLIDQAISPVVIEPQRVSGNAPLRWHTAVHPVDVTAVQIERRDPVETLCSLLGELRPELEQLRIETPDDDYLPGVVIVNSILSAIRLEDRLVECGFSRNSLRIIRGLSNRAIRDNNRNKLLAIGTSAIEVGVDFRCDHLLFEAFEAASFLQRFGRVGRHRPGKATALVPPNAFMGMNALPPEIDRGTFEEQIYAWYPSANAHAWFVTTEHGMITARALAENLFTTVECDRQARPEVLVLLRERIEAILTGHAKRLGCVEESRRAKSTFDRCAAGKRHTRWLDTYRRLNRFRTSLPSIRVHDFMEQNRREAWGMGEYEADLGILLKRAVGLAWNAKLGMLTIRGIGKYRRVHASEIFSDDDCGLMLETKDFPSLLLYQDGEPTPISDLMGRENHIFAVAPKADVQEYMDWRFSAFESGKYILAFDGAALLLQEMCARRRRGSPIC